MSQQNSKNDSHLSDEQIASIARTEVARTLGIEGSPVNSLFFRWNNALPQANRGHAHRRARIEFWSRRSRISIISSGVYGAPLPKCIETARAEADRLAAIHCTQPFSPIPEPQACVPA